MFYQKSSIFGLLVICGSFISLGMKPTPNPSLEFKKIADRYEYEYFSRFPEQAQFWGRTDALVDRFMDHSLTALAQWHTKEDQFLRDLKKIRLQDLEGTPQALSYQLLKETLERQKDTRICKKELWDVNPLSGWHNTLTSLAEIQPTSTPKLRDAALKRWATVGSIVDAEIEALKTGAQAGYTAPKAAVHRVLKQFSLILNTPTESSPFFSFAKGSKDTTFQKDMKNLITESILPALKRYSDYLEQVYLPQARDSIGVSALPPGKKCYSSLVQKEATLSISPQAVFDYGLHHMEGLKKEINEIGKRLWNIQGVSQIFRAAKEKSRGFFHSEKEILDYNLAALKRVQEKIPMFFTKTPRARGELKPYPLHQAQTGAPGEYQPPAEDGSRPGIFYINTFQPQTRPRVDQEATLFHELIPGHHFQIAMALETPTGHSLDKYLWNSGYGEGWALYVERLADEMGLYQDDISRLGMLSNEALRAARLVVDPGMHVLNWSREKAITYLNDHTALDKPIVEGEIDRYIMNPGQATSYLLGKREIGELRTLAKTRLGKKFDIKEFHHEVLKNGGITLPMLRAQIYHYIESNNLGQ